MALKTAKALDPSPEGDPSQSPTLTAAATQVTAKIGEVEWGCWRSCESEEMWTAVDGRQRRFGLVRRCFWLSSASRFL